MIALEPEAASMYTRLLPIEKMIDDYGSPFISTFETGAKYMVLDAGGRSTVICYKLCKRCFMNLKLSLLVYVSLYFAIIDLRR